MSTINEKIHAYTCQPNADRHCLTCSDEVVQVKVIHINQGAGLALVEVRSQIEEIDITLVENIAVGDYLLAHGGAAIARQEEEANEIC